MRQSCYLISPSAMKPRSRCLCRLPSAPAARRTFSTLVCESFLRCLSPYHGGPIGCTCLVLPQRHRPSPGVDRSASRFFPRTATLRGRDFRGCSYSVMFRPPSLRASPDRSYRCKSPCRAAEAFTSGEQNVRRCLRPHRICLPPDYRQLAARGLLPCQIHSIVDCSPLPHCQIALKWVNLGISWGFTFLTFTNTLTQPSLGNS